VHCACPVTGCHNRTVGRGHSHITEQVVSSTLGGLCVEPSGVQALKNPNPLKDVEDLVVLVVAVLFQFSSGVV